MHPNLYNSNATFKDSFIMLLIFDLKHCGYVVWIKLAIAYYKLSYNLWILNFYNNYQLINVMQIGK